MSVRGENEGRRGVGIEWEAQRWGPGGGGGGGEGAPDVCNLLIEEHREVISRHI